MWSLLPHKNGTQLFMTMGLTWLLDHLPAPDSDPDQSLLQNSTFDEFGELKELAVMLLNTFLDASLHACHK